MNPEVRLVLGLLARAIIKLSLGARGMARELAEEALAILTNDEKG